MATTTYLTSNFGSGTDDGVGQKSTHSVWIKRTDFAGDDRSTIISGMNTNSSNYMKVRFGDNDRLQIYGVHSGSVNCNVETKAEFRDVSGWYHIVLQIDTTNSTASERIKWYVNGELQELNTATYPSAGEPNYLVISDDLEIGRNTVNDNEHFDGTMSHFNATYGTVYAPTAFGETDATTGEWKIKANITGVNYGTYGFFILKDGNSVTDQSGKGNNFTVAGGTLTKTEDCPSNVFATLNPLDNYYTAATFSNGNTSQTTVAGNYGWNASTLGMTSGKFYVEMKQTGFSGSSNYNIVGITSRQLTASNIYLGQSSEDWGYYAQGNGVYNGGSFLTTYASYTTNDIIGIALDLDNNKLYFSKNGTWQNSGVPTSGSTGTGAISVTANKTYFFASGEYGTSLVCNNSWNFGNGFFGTTAVSSAGTNASNNGIFEYDVPSGYTALSTKGLNL